MPSGPGIRVDTHIEAGDRVPADYDNLIAKLMVHAHDRDAAIDRLRRALDETEIGGVQTTLPFHRVVARSDAFRAGDLSTGWVDQHWDGEAARAEAVRQGAAARWGWRADRRRVSGVASADSAAATWWRPRRSDAATHARGWRRRLGVAREWTDGRADGRERAIGAVPAAVRSTRGPRRPRRGVPPG